MIHPVTAAVRKVRAVRAFNAEPTLRRFRAAWPLDCTREFDGVCRCSHNARKVA